jgi:SAM-dependent methyltransferase
MGYLDYYKYQAEARGVRTVEDVRRIAVEKAYLYDRLVRPWLPADTARPIGELACGHGSFLHWLKSRNFARAAGVDSSAEQVALARHAGASVDLDDVNRWLARQAPSSFAALIAIDLVEHLAKDDFMELLRATHLALAPGGCLILRLPNGDSPLVGRNLFNDITHIWTYTANCLQSLGAMHGFSAFEFADEGADAIRDHRWFKVPLAHLSRWLLRSLARSATRERVDYWGPNLWARLLK